MKILIACLLTFALTACGIVPRATPSLVQHDLGSGFRTQARKPLPLRAITVSATPVVAGLNMHYREASRPTTRGAYAYNRWAAPPSTLVDQALNRLLPVAPAGRCRLSFQISDFILDIDEQGSAAALLAGTQRIYLDGRTAVYKRIVDIRIPVSQIDPSGLAMGLRKAVIELAEQTSGWVSGDIETFCLQP